MSTLTSLYRLPARLSVPITRLACLNSRSRIHPNLRKFSQSSTQYAFSESDLHSDDSRKKAIDDHKHDGLDKQRKGKGEWKSELSSNSESAIKADRHDIGNAEHDIETMQKHTSRAAQESHEHGKKV